jgi:hypothetical protein
MSEDRLIHFRRLGVDSKLYESEIEDLLWDNVEEIAGEPLFLLFRQKAIPSGMRPDVVALDESGRVVVVEVKRDIARSQLAQTLEYAGWARNASLDELAGLYHRGPDAFFEDWQAFTDTPRPVLINPSPRLILVARDFDERTDDALKYLIDSGTPLTLVAVTMYEDADGRRFVDVANEYDPEISAPAALPSSTKNEFTKFAGRRVEIADLLEWDFAKSGDELEWNRPRAGEHHTAVLGDDGSIQLPDGQSASSPSKAANLATGGSFDGWNAWRVVRLDGKPTLGELRTRYVEQRRADASLVRPPTHSIP